MRKCLKILNLLIEKKVAETEGDRLKVQKYEGMIKCHVEKCPDCRTFLEGIRQKNKAGGDEDTMAKKPSWLAVMGTVLLFLVLFGLIVALRWEKGSNPPLRTGSAREEVRNVTREVLFEAVREQGDLSLQITGTDIAIPMPSDFWKNLIERFEKPTSTDQDFERWDLTRKDEVIQILKQGIADQEEEVRKGENL